jgi:hypothetical protein
VDAQHAELVEHRRQVADVGQRRHIHQLYEVTQWHSAVGVDLGLVLVGRTRPAAAHTGAVGYVV